MKTLKQNGKDFGIFFYISQQFGKWDVVELKNASEKERDLIRKTQEILNKYGVTDNSDLLKALFNSLSENEKYTCLNGLEVITKYMKYHYSGINYNKKRG